MRRGVLTVTTALLLAAACGGLRGGQVPPSTVGPAESPSPSAAEHARFVPRTYLEGDSVVMPVTFPDGTTAELVYPPELDLAGMKAQPYGSGYGLGFARDFLVIYGTVEEFIGTYDDAELLATYEDLQGGTVGFWRLPPDGVYLAFQFGSWTVLVYDYGSGEAQMSDEDRGLWATNLHGRDTEDGFLVLEADPPLTLAWDRDYDSPELEFWSRAGDFTAVLLFVGECTPYHEGEGGFDHIEMVGGLAVSRDSQDFAAWCIPDGSMTVHVYQKPGDTFIDAVLGGLEVRNVELAS